MDFEVKDIRGDFGRCTIETGALENMGVAVGILHVSWLEPEIRGGVKLCFVLLCGASAGVCDGGKRRGAPSLRSQTLLLSHVLHVNRQGLQRTGVYTE
jgi:hypothetical protein